MRRLLLALAVGLLAATTASPANAFEQPATGTFSWTTAPGILPAWDRAGIALVGVSPGSVITSTLTSSARVSLPIVAKAGTANATAGGFRFVNTKTGESVRCSVPSIDTRARVVDCVLNTGYNAAIFEITNIDSRSKVSNTFTRTTLFQGMELRIINQQMADRLNEDLDTKVFSASVVVGNGDLVVTRDE